MRADKQIIYLVSILVLVTSVCAQESDTTDPMHQLLTARQSSECGEYIFNARQMLPSLYANGDLDSIRSIVAYIRDRCPNQSLENVWYLLKIEDGSFPDNPCDSAMLDYMLVHMSYGFSCGLSSRNTYFFDYASSPYYDSLETNWSRKLVASTDSLSIPHLFARRLGRDFNYGFTLLKNGAYAGTCLQARYDKLVDSALGMRQRFRWHWSLFNGVWLPTKKSNPLYPAYELGASCGPRFENWGVEIAMAVRFADHNRSIILRHDNKLVNQEVFVGFYTAIGPTYRLSLSNRWSMELLAAVGYDNFQSLTENDEYEYINSYAISFGATQRFFLDSRQDKYLGLQARYTMVDYHTHGGTDLSGNTLALNLVFGWEVNTSANWELNRLRYYAR